MSGALIVFIVIMAIEFVAVFGSMTFGIVRDKKEAKAAVNASCEESSIEEAEEKAEEVAVAEEKAEEVAEETVEEDDTDDAEESDDGEGSALASSKSAFRLLKKYLIWTIIPKSILTLFITSLGG